jgi:predicted PurR-regulated permease PerM
MLLDWDRMVACIDSWLPRSYLETIRGLAREIDRAIAGFVRGQGTLCLILGIFYALGLSLVGLNYALLIGLGAGLISFVPYVGSTLGLVVAVGVAFFQFWPEWGWILAVLGVFGVGQFIEGNILQPKLVGSSVGLHPVWLMFALFAFGYLFGFVGMLMAVPLAAAIGVLARFALRQYLASPLYDQAGGGTESRQ